MSANSGAVGFFYGNAFGRFLLKIVMKLHLDRIAVWFLRSRLSKPMVKGFVKRNGISVTEEEIASFRSWRDMFARFRELTDFDKTPDHLISPCDGYLSTFPIDEESCFAIKSSHYQLKDFLQDEELAKKYVGGTCMILRLAVSNYHHYCYIDDGYQGKNHFIPGVLHSVQPLPCEKYQVFVLNRRSWCLMDTDNFGPVVQCEIGAMVVGGICNELEDSRFSRGQEKGRFELAGSTIVLLFEKGRISLRPEITAELSKSDEVAVKQGEWIAISEK